MRLSSHSDLAVRLFLYLDAQEDKERRVLTPELCQVLDTKRSTVNETTSSLAKVGLLDTRSGKYGGIILSRPISDILVSEVISICEQRSGWQFAQCDNPAGCDCYMKGHCAVQPMYQQALHEFIRIFDKFCLADLQTDVNVKVARRAAEKYISGNGLVSGDLERYSKQRKENRSLTDAS